jgi:hypothetical protein
MFKQLGMSLVMSLVSIIPTKTSKATPEHDLLLVLFDVKYSSEGLIPGHTGSAKYFVYKKTNFLRNTE